MFKVIVTQGNNSALVKKILLQRGNWQPVQDPSTPDLQNQLPKANFVWTPNSLPLRYYHIAQQTSRSKPILLNHLQPHRVLTTKANLIRTLRNYYTRQQSAYKANYNVFVTTPTTYIISNGNEDREYFQFQQRYGELEKGNSYREKVNKRVIQVPAKHCKQNLWLVKPANMNQGRGIQMVRSMKQLVGFLGGKPLNSLWVVQKYIERPLLYCGRKFDIRVWVLVTGKCEVHYYTKGYIRTSSDEYSLDKSNNYIHLTNNCLQKYGSGYSKFEQGNTLPLETLQTYINSLEQYKDLGFQLERDIVLRMKDIIIDTIVAAKKSFVGRRRQFELFGYDFMIDEDLRTWLIEVNTNPYLGVPNDYIKDLLNRMIDDMLKIVVDPVFPPKNKDIYSPENDFQLLYSQDPAVNLRSAFTKPVYPFQSLAQYPNRLKQQSAPSTQYAKPFKQYNVDDHLKQLISTYPFADYQPFLKPVTRLLSELLNWQLQQSYTNHVKSLKSLFQSKFSGVLVNERLIPTLVKMIDSQSFPTEIQTVIIEGVMMLCRSIETKVKVASPEMVVGLVRVALTMFDDREVKKFDKGLIKTAIKCLMALAGVYSLKCFVPGETREHQAIKDLFIRCGGLSVLLLAAEEEDFKEELAQFLSYLTISDWEKQLSTLKNTLQTKYSNKSFKLTPVSEPQTITFHKDGLIQKVQEKIHQHYERIQKRERDIQQKKQKHEQQQQKFREEREKAERERKIRAQQYMRRKNMERLKQKEQQERKVAELKVLQEEKRKKFEEEIAKRREQLNIIRNQSIKKIQKEKQKQKNKEKEKQTAIKAQEEQKKQKHHNREDRRKILTEWLAAKKEQSKIKRLSERKQQLISNRPEDKKRRLNFDYTLYMTAKTNNNILPKDNPTGTHHLLGIQSAKINSQNTKEYNTNKPKKLQRQNSLPNEQNTAKNSKFPKMLPSKLPRTSITKSDEGNQTKKQQQKKTIITMDDKVKTLRCFMNVVKRTIKRRQRSLITKQQTHSHQIPHIPPLQSKQLDNPLTRTLPKDKKQKARAVIEQILSSPYSSFVKRNQKFVYDQVQKLIQQ